jgi:hypothetical protein
MKSLAKLIAAAALSLATVALAEDAKPTGPTITPYGFVLANMYSNTGTFAATDNPLVANSEAGGALVFSARQSRFGLKMAMNDDNWTGAALTGQIEVDFLGGHIPGTPVAACKAAVPPATAPTCTITQGPVASSGWNAAIMRLRLATMTAAWKTDAGTISVLAGQDFGLVNPLFATSLAWVGNPLFNQNGNLWRRSPQFRLTWGNDFGAVGALVQLAVLSPADGTTPVDFGAGNRSTTPDFEGRLGISFKAPMDVSGTVGVGYHTNKRKYDGANGYPPTKDVTATLTGIDADLNLTKYLQVKGEWYDGKGTDDSYNGIISNGVRNLGTAAAPDYLAVGSSGYWGQGIIKPLPIVWLTIGMGHAELKAADLAGGATAVAASQRTKAEQVAGGVILNAGKYWKFGVEYLKATTTFNTTVNPKQDATQLAVSSQLLF